MNGNKIKIICANVLLISAIIVFLFVHGTNNLLLVHYINSLIPIIPLVSGKITNCPLLTNYIVDFLWYNSFILYLLAFKIRNLIFPLTLSILLEVLQLIFSTLGTFDIFDILLYIVLTLIWKLIISIKLCNNI